MSNLPLRQLVKNTELVKSSSGSFFLISGSYSNKEYQYTQIKMYVLADGIYTYVELPIRSLKIKIDNKVETPYLYINYTHSKKLTNTESLEYLNSYIKNVVILVCPEKYLPEQLLPINL